MVDYLPTWHRVDELVHEVQFVGVERPGIRKRNTVSSAMDYRTKNGY